jgi:radical SAM protein with 4Fe4S-binding SPASM domain
MNRRRLKKVLKRLNKLPKGEYLFFYISNKVKHFYFKIIKSTKVAYPSTIMLELTNNCNLTCTTCPREYDYGKAMDKGFMKVEQIKSIIDDLWPYLDSIGLTGMGETFLFKEIQEIVDYIKTKNKGIIISISTNAVLPSFIERVSKIINKVDTVQISIDGLEFIYENIRINASFKQLDENLRLLSKICKNTETDLMLNMVVTKENFHQMSKLVKYAEEIDIEYLDFTLFNLVSVTNIDRTYYDFYKSNDFLNAFSQLKETINDSPKVLVTTRNFKTDNSFQKCPFPWTHFYICWNGFVPPCCAKPFPKELSFGNVFNTNMIDILNNEEYRKFRTLWYKNITPDFCNKCHFIDIAPINNNR